MDWLEVVMSVVGDQLGWAIGCVAFLMVGVGLFVASLKHRIRKEWWFHGTVLLAGLVFAAALVAFPELARWAVLYRADWSMVYLLNHLNGMSLLTLMVFHVMAFVVMGVSLLAMYSVWSLLTLRFDRLKTLWRRALRQSWSVLFYMVILMACEALWSQLFVLSSGEMVRDLFSVVSFVFLLQLSVQFLDSGVFSRPEDVLRFCLVSALGLWLGKAGVDVGAMVLAPVMSFSTLFYQLMLSFFLALLVGGLFAASFVHSRFSSSLLQARWSLRSYSVYRIVSLLFLDPFPLSFSGQRLFRGALMSIGAALVVLFLVYKGMFLELVPVFFLEFFLLFYCLDQQQDLLKSGGLVEQRSDFADRKLPIWLSDLSSGGDVWEFAD